MAAHGYFRLTSRDIRLGGVAPIDRYLEVVSMALHG
jgi:hypothetical protein